jgi:putative aldouronate transport system permease protein
MIVQKRTLPEYFFDSFNSLLLIMIMMVTLYPILYVIIASFSTPSAIYQSKGFLIFPINPTIEGYQLVFQNPSILSGYKNTLLYMAIGTPINLLLTSLGAYVLSRRKLKWGKLMMMMIVITMYFSGGLIPLFLIVRNLGLINKIWAILLPGAISSWNLIVMRTSFQSMPESLEESAKIDGANDFTILFHIVIPLNLSILAVMALFYGVGHWNAWFYAVIFLRERSMYPLQLILREILIMNVERETFRLATTSNLKAVEMMQLLKYSVIVVTTVPILFIYPFLQKYFVKGVMIGSLKE